MVPYRGAYSFGTPGGTNGGGLYWRGAVGNEAAQALVLREPANGTQPRISENNGTGERDIIDTVNGDARYVPKSGATMTGALTLSGAPTAALHAATKKYVDDSVQASGNGAWAGAVNFGYNEGYRIAVLNWGSIVEFTFSGMSTDSMNSQVVSGQAVLRNDSYFGPTAGLWVDSNRLSGSNKIFGSVLVAHDGNRYSVMIRAGRGGAHNLGMKVWSISAATPANENFSYVVPQDQLASVAL
jgi:hypothetical protein